MPDRWFRHLRSVGASIFVIFCFTATCTSEETTEAPPRVRNPAEPSGGTKHLSLEELWRVGGADEEILFGRVIRAAVDQEENIYLLDAQLCHVEVFSPEGEHLRTLGREGDGPGEVRQPADMIFLPGDILGILTRFPGKLTKLDRNGHPAGSIMINSRDATEGGFTAAHYGAAAGDNLLVVGNEILQAEGGQERLWFVGRYDHEGHEVVRLHEVRIYRDFQRPAMIERDIIASFLSTSAPARDGRVYLAPFRHEYKVHVYAPNGSLERIIEREYTNRPRAPIQVQRVRDVLEGWAARRGGEVGIEVEEVAASILGVRVTDAGELWVDTSSSAFDQPEGVFKTYDVFDPEGRFTNQVSVHCEGDPLDDELFFLRDDLAVLIKDYHSAFYAIMGRVSVDSEEAEAANMEIVVYRVLD